jgi:hypothetical protein
VVQQIAAKDRVPVEKLLKDHCRALSDDDLGPAATYIRTKAFG